MQFSLWPLQNPSQVTIQAKMSALKSSWFLLTRRINKFCLWNQRRLKAFNVGSILPAIFSIFSQKWSQIIFLIGAGRGGSLKRGGILCLKLLKHTLITFMPHLMFTHKGPVLWSFCKCLPFLDPTEAPIYQFTANRACVGKRSEELCSMIPIILVITGVATRPGTRCPVSLKEAQCVEVGSWSFTGQDCQSRHLGNNTPSSFYSRDGTVFLHLCWQP